MLRLWVIEAYFTSLSFDHWKKYKTSIFQKKGKKSGVLLLNSMFACRKFAIILSMKL